MSDDKNVPNYKEKGQLTEFFLALTKNESIGDIRKFVILMITIAFMCAVFYVASYDPKALTDKFYIYSVFGVLPVAIGIAIASKIFDGDVDIHKFYLYGGLLFLFIVSMYMFYRILDPSMIVKVSYLLRFVIALAFIVGLAILYRIFVRTIMSTRGWLGFCLKFLFLIPCLLIEFLEYVSDELKVAPKMVTFLFILEIIIILAYIYIPRFTKPSSDSIVLLNKPVFLSNVQTIGTANQLFMDANERDNPSKSLKMVRQDYSISMWFYVNQHPNTYAAYSKETNIFRYGYPNSKIGHPRVAYFNDRTDPNKSDKYIVYLNDDAKDVSGVLLEMPTQSWSQLVISYTDATVDLFVNGDLVKTAPMPSDARPVYNESDIIEVGEGNNTVTGGGLHGAICNVVYHKTPMTPFQVSGEYNLKRYNNPPINND